MTNYTPDEEQLVRGFTARHVDVVERGEDETFSEYLSRASVRTQQIQVESEAAARRAVEQIKAAAWDEGAEAAWWATGEGFNGEYVSGHDTHDGAVSFQEATDGDVPNPYREATHE